MPAGDATLAGVVQANAPERLERRRGRAGRRAVLALTGALVFTVAWIATYPGWGEPASDAAALLIVLLALLGVAVGVLRVWRAGRPVSRRALGWWIGALLVGVLLAVHAPLRLRFAGDRAEFDAEVLRLQGTPPFSGAAGGDDWIALDPSADVGSYSVRAAYRLGDAVVFYDTAGGWIDDAGFAYVPGEPDQVASTGPLEASQFVHLGGPWYAWTARRR